jgi:hypothetical protein
MTRLVLASCLAFAACDKPATRSEPAATKAAPAFHLALGDATVYELVDRRWRTREKPTRDLVLHADGTAEVINDKTDKPWITWVIKEDGTVLGEGKLVAMISEHVITDVKSGKPLALSIDGDTISVQIDSKTVKVVLASDGNITVIDRPDGNKWRIDAKDPAVMRSAFLALALTMKTALD